MAYEIPQKLQYEEKILFGLTFKQLVYALIFLLPALLIFLRTKIPLFLKMLIGMILITIGLLFMFFNFQSYAKNMLAWLRFRQATPDDKKMRDFIGSIRIEQSVIYVSRK